MRDFEASVQKPSLDQLGPIWINLYGQLRHTSSRLLQLKEPQGSIQKTVLLLRLDLEANP